jgi:hypothetical protein
VVAEGDHVGIGHQRPTPFEVGEESGTAAGDHREVLAGDRAEQPAVAGVAKVQVAVDEGEAVGATSAQRQHRAQQDAAVAPQQQREPARDQQLAQPVGKPHRIVGDRQAVAGAGGVMVGGVGGRLDPAAVVGAQPRHDSLLPQHLRKSPAPRDRARRWRPQPKVGRGVDHDDVALGWG